MTLRKIPEARTFDRPQNFQWDAPSHVLARWADTPQAAVSDDPSVISIFDVIGEDPWTDNGFTVKRMSAALRAIGPKPVTVQINSPGGDMFSGIAIYNMLREHPAEVKVNVLGWAASAASIIAMAADDIAMGTGSFMMIHNASGVVIGNRHDMRDAAKLFDSFDAAIADIYEARTGMKRSDIVKLMDNESFMGPSEAIKNGFADRTSDDAPASARADATPSDRGLKARRQTEAALAKAGFSRNVRAEMLADLMGEDAALRDASGNEATPRDASRPAARDAGNQLDVAALARLLETMKS